MADVRDPDFYLAHASYVRALARRLVYDPHAADDLFQAAWLAALERPDRVGTTPRRWLARIVHNIASKTWLRAKRRAAREQQWQPATTSTPEEVLAHEHERRRVVDALLQLEEPYRATLIGRFFDGLEPAALAARDGVPVETVRTRQKRGLQRLRERLLPGDDSAVAMAIALQLGAPDARSVLMFCGRGVLLMPTKKLLVAFGLLVLATIGWFAVPDSAPSARNASPLPAAPIAAPPPGSPASATAATTATAAARTVAPTDATAAVTGSLLVRVIWADRRPAGDIAVRVGRLDAPNFERSVVVRRTGVDGLARFDALATGQVHIECDRGASVAGTIAAGSRAEVQLLIPRGAHLHGHVFDLDGRPAANASIHLVCSSTAGDGARVATSADDGSFAIDDAPAERTLSLSASAPQRAPTGQVFVTAKPGAEIEVELRFTAHGGAITGHVVDDNGRPVAAALAVVGRDDLLFWERAAKAGGNGPPLSNRRASGDADGNWAIDGLPAGSTPVLVVAEGMAPWSGEAFVVAGSTVRCDAVLSPAPRLVGTVRTETGAPAANARVRVGEWGLQTVATTTAVDGTFELAGLPIGNVHALASATGAGEAEGTFATTAGAVLRWDPTLQRATTLHGRIVADGKPVAGAQIAARPMPSAQMQWFADAISAADGSFEFTNCPPALLHLEARTKESGQFTVVKVEDVDPRAGEVTLEVDATRQPSAIVVGRVVDPDGHAIADAEVLVLATDSDWGGGHSLLTAKDGTFRSPACPPGEWYLTVSAPGFAQLATPRRTLAAATTTDLGELQVVRGVAVVVTLQPQSGLDLDGLAVAIGSEHVSTAVESASDGVVRFADVAPGDRILTTFAPGIALRPVRVHVVAGQTTTIDLPLRAGSEVTVDVRDERGEPVVDWLTTELRDGHGEVIDRTPLAPAGGPMQWRRRLVADRYELRLRDHRGRSATVPIVVGDDGKPVAVTARLP